jgi:Ala-tRNA(Pro) deacylase
MANFRAMPATPAELFAALDRLGIKHATVSHPPLFTVEQSQALRGSIPGGHTKNLFLKDKKGVVWLVVALEDRRIDLKELRHRIGAAPLSFAGSDLLREVLGVEPGSVTPFALINDEERRTRVVLDAEMMAAHPVLNFHPLANTATTAIRAPDLLAFIRSCGHDPRIIDL